MLLSQYDIFYSSLVIKLQSLGCPWCSRSCLSWVRRLRVEPEMRIVHMCCHQNLYSTSSSVTLRLVRVRLWSWVRCAGEAGRPDVRHCGLHSVPASLSCRARARKIVSLIHTRRVAAAAAAGDADFRRSHSHTRASSDRTLSMHSCCK